MYVAHYHVLFTLLYFTYFPGREGIAGIFRRCFSLCRRRCVYPEGKQNILRAMIDTETVALKERLRAEMRRCRLTPPALAARAGVGRSFIYDLLSGKAKNPTSGNIKAVAGALGVSVPYLIGGECVPSDVRGRGGYIPVCELKPGPGEKKEYYVCTALLDNTAAAGNLLMLKIRSDDMAPTFIPGDTVLIDTGYDKPGTAGIYVLHDGERIFVRRVDALPEQRKKRWRIRADNTNYTAYLAAPEEITVIGKVVWRGTAL